MSERGCLKSGCSVAESGVCLAGHPDFAKTCPNYVQNDPQQVETNEVPSVGEQEFSGRRFRAGMELGREDAAVMMARQYTYVIGIVGPTNSGKTCFLVSMYLKLSHAGVLPPFRFAGSSTLNGFEERSRHAREWSDAKLPDTLADRTVLQDPRQPGLLHLCLQAQHDEESELLNVLFTDLPGEWFTRAVGHAEDADRLQFLKRADGLILIVDGARLSNKDERNGEVYFTQVLLHRLKETVEVDVSVPLVVLISKCDLFDATDVHNSVKQIEHTAQELGFDPKVVFACSFSSAPQRVPSSSGIEQAISHILRAEFGVEPLHQLKRPVTHITRSFWHFRD
jgi:hypothetical protein